MDAQDITTLAIGYGILCVGIFVYVVLKFRRLARHAGIDMSEMPLWMVASFAGLSVCPLINLVMLVNTIRLKPE